MDMLLICAMLTQYHGCSQGHRSSLRPLHVGEIMVGMTRPGDEVWQRTGLMMPAIPALTARTCSESPDDAVAGLAALSGLRPCRAYPRAARSRPGREGGRRLVSPGLRRTRCPATSVTHEPAMKVKSSVARGGQVDLLERIAPDRLHGLVRVGLSVARGLPRSKLSQPGHLRDLDGGFLHLPLEDRAGAETAEEHAGMPAGGSIGFALLATARSARIRLRNTGLRAWPRWA